MRSRRSMTSVSTCSCSRGTAAPPPKPWRARWGSTMSGPRCCRVTRPRSCDGPGRRDDAPALAAASLGIAIGAGADVAIETAGVVLMKDDPADVPRALVLAHRVRRKIVQNLFWAAIYNVLAIPLAAGVLYPAFGILLKPAWAAPTVNARTLTPALNGRLLPPLGRPTAARAAPA